jgi:8-oxo-dGTP diphosphatase
MPNAMPTGLQRFLGSDGIVERVRVAAYAWCMRDGSLLLCRVANRGPGGGQWTLPGGGLRFGEDPLDALLREVGEETGLTVTPGEILGVRSATVEPGETISGHRIQMLGIVYCCAVTGGKLRDEVDGSTDRARWVPSTDTATLPLAPLVRWAVDTLREA